jgi:hypothetical protein
MPTIGARRKDANHNELVQAAREVGAEVLELYKLPGALDCLIGYRGSLYLVEIKDGSKPASRRALTPPEVETIRRFQAVGVRVVVATDVDSLLRGIGAVL